MEGDFVSTRRRSTLARLVMEHKFVSVINSSSSSVPVELYDLSMLARSAWSRAEQSRLVITMPFVHESSICEIQICHFVIYISSRQKKMKNLRLSRSNPCLLWCDVNIAYAFTHCEKRKGGEN